jgi:hypothetical protein
VHNIPESPISNALAGRTAGDALLPEVVAGAQAAGKRVRDRFSADARPGSREEAFAAPRADAAASLAVLRGPLAGAKRASGSSGAVSEEEVPR